MSGEAKNKIYIFHFASHFHDKRLLLIIEIYHMLSLSQCRNLKGLDSVDKHLLLIIEIYHMLSLAQCRNLKGLDSVDTFLPSRF